MQPQQKNQNKDKSPIVIVGAGLAGLACASTLQKQNIPFLLLEKNLNIGGKLATTNSPQGFKLDHGYQVLQTSYPELDLFLDLKKLNLMPFNSGCLVYKDGQLSLLVNPLVHPLYLINQSLSNVATIKDKVLVLKLILQSWWPWRASQSKISTGLFLQKFGFSTEFINNFWNPFLSGVFLDPDLTVDAEFFLFLIKGFSSGRVAVPALGMQEIPRQIAESLIASSVRCSSEVHLITNDHVILKSGEKIDAKQVVVAHNPSVNQASYYSVQNLYFTTTEKLDWGSWLVIIPRTAGLKISTIAIMNNVAPTYALNKSEQLLSVSVIGIEPVDIEKIKQELRQISQMPLKDLKFIEKFEIRQALPIMNDIEKNGFVIKNKIYYCGDWAVNPSINGALKSGRLVAEKIISDMRN